jgi:hypothetical protein
MSCPAGDTPQKIFFCPVWARRHDTGAVVTLIPSIETFASLCALLDASRKGLAETLAAAGLDEAGWQRVRAAWLARLAAGDTPALATRFAQLYAHARQHPEELHLPVAAPTPRADVPALVDGEDTTPDGALEAEPDLTAEIALPLAGPATPFRAPPLLPPPPALALPESPIYLPELPPADGTEATVEVPFSPPPPPHAALPFAPPMRGRPQRLVRFDTATGRPLPQPYWIDEPTPPQLR